MCERFFQQHIRPHLAKAAQWCFHDSCLELELDKLVSPLVSKDHKLCVGINVAVAPSGAGKSRLAYELLVSNGGIYFVASVNNNSGSQDLQFVIDQASQYEADVSPLILSLLLARFFIMSRLSQTGLSNSQLLLAQIHPVECFECDAFFEVFCSACVIMA